MQPNPDPSAYKHDVFISYSRKNETFARKLEQALETYRPPKGVTVSRRYLEVFRDKEDFTAGDYGQNLSKHLKESAKLIVICSPEARRSDFVNDEIRRFAQMRGPDHIIPVLFSGIPNNEAKPGQEDDMAFPEALCSVMEMPLAVNYLGWRIQSDKVNKGTFSEAWYGTLANIYDISRSEIEQREKKRRARTRRITYSVLSGGLAVLSILLVFALASRSQALAARVEADRQRGEAVTARESEEKERKRAEEQEQVAKSERDTAIEAKRQTQEALGRETVAKNQAEERRKEAERQRQIADEQTVIAEDRARLATARQLAAQALAASEETSATIAYGTVGPERSALLALESLKRFQTTEGTRSLRGAIARMVGKEPEIKFTEADNVDDFSLSPDGKTVAFIKNGKAHLRSLSTPSSPDWLVPVANPLAMIFSPDGTRLALFRDDSTLIWEVATREQRQKLPPCKGTIESVFNSNGSQLIALSETGLQAWDILSARVVRQITPPHDTWASASLSPGGKWLATQDAAGIIQVTDVATDRELGRFRNKDIHDLSLSQDGKLLATTTDKGVDVWRVKGWRRIAASLPHEWTVQEMAFSADGRWLTTVTGKVSMDASDMTSTSFPGSAIRVWDLMNQRRLVMHVSLAQEGGFVATGKAFSFTPNGDRLTSASHIITPAADGGGSIESEGTRLLTWVLLPTDLTKKACSLLTRNLSDSEWKTFMGRDPYRLTCKGLPKPEE